MMGLKAFLLPSCSHNQTHFNKPKHFFFVQFVFLLSLRLVFTRSSDCLSFSFFFKKKMMVEEDLGGSAAGQYRTGRKLWVLLVIRSTWQRDQQQVSCTDVCPTTG